MEAPMNISFKAKVACADGPCGQLKHIVLKSVNDEITHLIIKDETHQGIEHLVPIEMVSKSDHNQIQLSCTRSELKDMPSFTRKEYVPREAFTFSIKPYLLTTHAVLPDPYIPVSVEQIPAGELAVIQGTPVEATDGPIGSVDELLMESEDNCISHLILREGSLWEQKDVTIPVEKIDRIEDGTVYLNLSKTEVKSLPTVPIHRFWRKK
jgi:sporulation protein YlmC with PRC-barrel domain